MVSVLANAVNKRYILDHEVMHSRHTLPALVHIASGIGHEHNPDFDGQTAQTVSHCQLTTDSSLLLTAHSY